MLFVAQGSPFNLAALACCQKIQRAAQTTAFAVCGFSMDWHEEPQRQKANAALRATVSPLSPNLADDEVIRIRKPLSIIYQVMGIFIFGGRNNAKEKHL
jgi:glutamine synthetase type III